jgi:hypothetical protein
LKVIAANNTNHAQISQMIKDITSILSPEESLLILAARLNLDEDTEVNIEKIIGEKIDWAKVKSLSHRLGISPLLYRHLSRDKFSAQIPGDVHSFFKKRYLQESMKNLRIYGQLIQILKSMNEADIPAIPLKGTFLAKWIYEDIALRPMSDIDILCRKKDLPAVQEKLTDLGYNQKAIYRSKLHEKLAAKSMGSCHLPVFSRPDSFGVEIHFRLFSKTSENAEEISGVWEKSIPAKMDGNSIFILSPEDQLLYLAFHLFIHIKGTDRDVPLYWFCDINEWIVKNNDSIDWNLFCKKAESTGIGVQAGAILNLIKNNWNSPVPDTVLPRLTGQTEDISLKDIFRRRNENYLRTLARQIRLELNAVGWKSWTLLMARYAFPSRKYLSARYKPNNPYMIYIYYIIHPYRIIRRAFISFYYSLAVNLKRGLK